jgi:hypothetical protein
MPKFAGYEVERMMIMSTSHITAEDNRKLLNDDHTPCGCFFDLTPKGDNYPGSGFLVACSEDLKDGVNDDDMQAMIKAGWSKAMVDIQVTALSRDCSYIRLDPDGMVYPDLPTFEW